MRAYVIHTGVGHIDSESAQHFDWNLTNVFCTPDVVRTRVTDVSEMSSPTLYQLSHPVTLIALIRLSLFPLGFSLPLQYFLSLSSCPFLSLDSWPAIIRDQMMRLQSLFSAPKTCSAGVMIFLKFWHFAVPVGFFPHGKFRSHSSRKANSNRVALNDTN